ncbi:hypothetical protein HOLleu_37969 [Holothuria leucospilota]|uniref:Uncharacterized protein n=1 Tax=Holothuria leucospilota TaxID=206669 RepID=A0A9Q0YK86_HOLLE|nr:hypothetical protein HOLleu_37969 [Holothuria leucospilota]
MSSSEPLDAYIHDIEELCERLQKTAKEKMTIFVRGLVPDLRRHVIQRDPGSWSDAVHATRLAQEASTLDHAVSSQKPTLR